MASITVNVTAVIFIIMTTFISTSTAEIRFSKIRSDSSRIIPLDEFGFTNNGRLELNVSKLSFSSSTTTDAFDLSNLGFFLYKRSSWLQVRHMENNELACALKSNITEYVFNLSSLAKGATSFDHVYLHSHKNQYVLAFTNCLPQNASVKVSMDVRSTMYNLNDKTNTRDYLSAGTTILPTVYLVLSLVYFSLAVVWVLVMYKRRSNVYGLHFIMLTVVILKALSLIFEVVEKSYIKQTGTAHGWDVMFIIFDLFKGVTLFILLAVIGVCIFLKHYLNCKVFKVMHILIPLQFYANKFPAVIDGFGSLRWLDSADFLFLLVIWLVFWLIDVVCCFFVLLNLFISIVDYKEAAKTDGNAAVTLMKLKHLARYYVAFICYMYFTRCIEVFEYFRLTSYYKYLCTWVVAAEIATLAFYVFTGYSFKPKVPRNQTFPVDDEADLEAASS